jgi:hypothetical protein
MALAWVVEWELQVWALVWVADWEAQVWALAWVAEWEAQDGVMALARAVQLVWYMKWNYPQSPLPRIVGPVYPR